jgi:hypothetical protein
VAAVVSVQIADVGVGAGFRLLGKRPKDGSIPGLRHADIAAATPLSASVVPRPGFSRIALYSFWDDDEALDAFVRTHPLAARFHGGWHARLQPLRAFGSWPGLDEDISRSRHTSGDGPVVVLTLGRLRLTRTVRFLRTSAKAEAAALAAPGSLWATALARPPFVSTCSLWESTKAVSGYAYGRVCGHPDAIDADAAQPFHHRSAFVRFRPYHVEGSLTGPNPLREHTLVAQPQS